jgi:2-methylcitrate dehydratase PrpD
MVMEEDLSASFQCSKGALPQFRILSRPLRSHTAIPWIAGHQRRIGQSFTHEVSAYPGSSARPFTWQEIEAKFEKLAAGRAPDNLLRQIKRAVRSLEDLQVSDLTKLLGTIPRDAK